MPKIIAFPFSNYIFCLISDEKKKNKNTVEPKHVLVFAIIIFEGSENDNEIELY